jgi:hypothetical protein
MKSTELLERTPDHVAIPNINSSTQSQPQPRIAVSRNLRTAISNLLNLPSVILAVATLPSVSLRHLPDNNLYLPQNPGRVFISAQPRAQTLPDRDSSHGIGEGYARPHEYIRPDGEYVPPSSLVHQDRENRWDPEEGYTSEQYYAWSAAWGRWRKGGWLPGYLIAAAATGAYTHVLNTYVSKICNLVFRVANQGASYRSGFSLSRAPPHSDQVS